MHILKHKGIKLKDYKCNFILLLLLYLQVFAKLFKKIQSYNKIQNFLAQPTICETYHFFSSYSLLFSSLKQKQTPVQI